MTNFYSAQKDDSTAVKKSVLGNFVFDAFVPLNSFWTLGKANIKFTWMPPPSTLISEGTPIIRRYLCHPLLTHYNSMPNSRETGLIGLKPGALMMSCGCQIEQGSWGSHTHIPVRYEHSPCPARRPTCWAHTETQQNRVLSCWHPHPDMYCVGSSYRICGSREPSTLQPISCQEF